MDIQQELTKYIASAIHNELPEVTQKNTRFHLLDTLVRYSYWKIITTRKKSF